MTSFSTPVLKPGTPQPAFQERVDVDYYTHTDGRNAFWCAFTAPKPNGGYRVAVGFGSIGTEGQTQVKDFPSLNMASAFVEKKIEEKLRKGYVRRVDMEQSERIIAKGHAMLDLPKGKTANLLEVCETAVATAVDAVTSGGALSVEQVSAVHAARRAWSELRERFSELESNVEVIDALFEKASS